MLILRMSYTDKIIILYKIYPRKKLRKTYPQPLCCFKTQPHHVLPQ